MHHNFSNHSTFLEKLFEADKAIAMVVNYMICNTLLAPRKTKTKAILIAPLRFYSLWTMWHDDDVASIWSFCFNSTIILLLSIYLSNIFSKGEFFEKPYNINVPIYLLHQ